MKLFSEKVELTSTNSSLNIIYVENYEEIFFNVYEIEINKTKYISEKISIHDGCPVISVPVTVDDVQIYYPFVLMEGPQAVIFNKDNTQWTDIQPVIVEQSTIVEEPVEKKIEYPIIDEEVELPESLPEREYKLSELNILQVENYEEVFFNVYEININNTKYLAEKISEYKGQPIVAVPVDVNGEQLMYPFVLAKGKQEIVFNEDHDMDVHIEKYVSEPIELTTPKYLPPVEEEINYNVAPLVDNRQEILEQIENAKNKAKREVQRLKRKNQQELQQELATHKKLLDKTLADAKQSMVEEFVKISHRIKNELVDVNDNRFSEISETINNKIADITNAFSITIDTNFEESVSTFDVKLKTMVKEIHESIHPKVDNKLSEIATDIVEKVAELKIDINKKVSVLEKIVDKKLNTKADNKLLEEVKSEVSTVKKANIELHDTINKGVNKALSRVGNVSTRMDEFSEQVAKDLVERDIQLDEKVAVIKEGINKEIDTIKVDVGEVVNEKVSKIALNVAKKVDAIDKAIDEKIATKAEAADVVILAETIGKKVGKSLGELEATNCRLDTIQTNIENELNQLDEGLRKKANSDTVDELKNEVQTLEKANVELNENIVKGVNRALSRVGNVSTKVDDLTIALTEELDNRVQEVEANVLKYYSEKIKMLEEQTFDITEETRKIFIELVQESRVELLTELRKLKDEKPIQYVIESKGKKEVHDLDSIRKDFDKTISGRIDNEVTRLRKYIAVYGGGGGTVAQQFADGGTMNGNLIVNGDIIVNGSILVDTISVINIAVDNLSANYILVNNLSATGVIYVSGGNSEEWNSVYNTVQLNSAFWGTGGVSGCDCHISGLTANWQNTFATVSTLSSGWQETYTIVQAYSSIWGSGGTSACDCHIAGLTANWQNTFDTVSSLSGGWQDTYITVLTLSAGWQQTYTIVLANSAYWDSTYNTVFANSGKWEDVYNTVQAYSASWAGGGGSDVSMLTANWQNTFYTVSTLSGRWESTHNTVFSNSAQWAANGSDVSLISSNWENTFATVSTLSTGWESTHTTVFVNSAQWAANGSDVSTLSANWQNAYITIFTLSSGWQQTYTIVSSNSGNWDSVYNLVFTLSAGWQSVYTTVQTNSSRWESAYTTVQANSSKWETASGGVSAFAPKLDTVYETVNNLSGGWQNTYITVSTLSSGWQDAYNTVLANSAQWAENGSDVSSLTANWQNTFATVSTLSSGWQDTYNTVFTNSAYWGMNGSDVSGLSANWENTYNTVLTNSSKWETAYNAITTLSGLSAGAGDVYTIVNANSANWNTTYNTVFNLSTGWESTYTTVFVNSGNWESTYNTVFANSAQWGIDTGSDISQLSANWQNTFATMSTLSAGWESTYNTVFANSAQWAIDTGSDISMLSANWQNTFATVSTLSTGWESTHTNVYNNSANWEAAYTAVTYLSGLSAGAGDVYTIVNANSANWNTTYNTVFNLSGNWESTYTTVLVNSGSWTSVYNTVFANSGNWENTYNTVLVNSGNWESTYNTVFANSAQWAIDTGSDISLLSANWQNTFYTVSTLSSGWESTHTTVFANSAQWAMTGSDVSQLSANWENTFATVSTLSTGWESTHTTVFSNSAQWSLVGSDVSELSANWENTFATMSTLSSGWESTHNTVYTFSAAWSAGVSVSGAYVPYVGATSNVYLGAFSISATNVTATATVFAAGGNSTQWNQAYNTVFTLSTGWESTHTTVFANSAQWALVGSDVSTLSANWQNTYTTVLVNSSNWNTGYNTVFALSTGWESTHTTVFVNSSNWENTFHTVLNLSSGWESTHTTVFNNSANWDAAYTAITYLSGLSAGNSAVYTIVNANSANWNNTYITVSTLSTGWESTHTTVLVNSGNWESTYNTVYSNSSNWNAFQNTSGDFVPYIGAIKDVNLGVNNLSAGKITASDSLRVVRTIYSPTNVIGVSSNNSEIFSVVPTLSTKTEIRFTGSDRPDGFSQIYTSHDPSYDGGQALYINVGKYGNGGRIYVGGVNPDGSQAGAVLNLNNTLGIENVPYFVLQNTGNDGGYITSGAGSVLGNNGGDVVISTGAGNYITNPQNGNLSPSVAFKSYLWDSSALVNYTTGAFRFNTDATALTLTTKPHTIWEVHDIPIARLGMDGSFVVAGSLSSGGNIFAPNLNITNWENTFATVSSLSSGWESTHTTVFANSAQWALVGSDVTLLSANWQNAYTTVLVNSASWTNAYTTVLSNSSKWESVYTTVLTNSGSWTSAYTTVLVSSARWETVYNTVNVLSSGWQSVYTTVNAKSANWDAAFAGLTLKENLSNKVTVISGSNINNTFYPTTSAVYQLVNDSNLYVGSYTSPTIVDNGNGTINIGTAEYTFAADSTGISPITKYTIPGATYSLTNSAVNFILANYNGGSPILQSSTSNGNVDNQLIYPVFLITRANSAISIIELNTESRGLPNRLSLRFARTRRIEPETGGLIIGCTGRVATITAGTVWYSASNNTLSAVSISATPMRYYIHIGGTWTPVLSTQINNTQFDNGTNPQNLGGGNFGVTWLYRAIGKNTNQTYGVLGTANYSLAQAQVSVPPSNLPSEIVNSLLVGRIIIGSNDAAATQVDSAFATIFQASGVTDHEGLANLQGGAPGDHSHVLASERAYLQSLQPALTATGGVIFVPGGNSSQWNSTYTTVLANSAQWAIDTGSNISGLSANWENTYNTVKAKSANWDSAYNTVQANSGIWNAFQTTSGNYVPYVGATQGVNLGANSLSATNINASGHISATTKSFLIDNPNGGKLQYGVVESNEHGVYVRGKSTNRTIVLPEHWDWLVDEESVTVQLTPIGRQMNLYIISQDNHTIKVGGVEGFYNYTVYGTRKDVAPIIVNVKN